MPTEMKYFFPITQLGEARAYFRGLRVGSVIRKPSIKYDKNICWYSVNLTLLDESKERAVRYGLKAIGAKSPKEISKWKDESSRTQEGKTDMATNI